MRALLVVAILMLAGCDAVESPSPAAVSTLATPTPTPDPTTPPSQEAFVPTVASCEVVLGLVELYGLQDHSFSPDYQRDKVAPCLASFGPTPEPTPPPPKAVKFTGKGDMVTKAQRVIEGDYVAVIKAKGCDGNLILSLTAPGANMFDGDQLVNEIPNGSFSGKTYLYGLDGGRYVVNGTIASCRSWTVTLTPTS